MSPIRRRPASHRPMALFAGLLALSTLLQACGGTDSGTPATTAIHDSTYGFSLDYPARFTLITHDTGDSYGYALYPDKQDVSFGIELRIGPRKDSTAIDTSGVGLVWNIFRSFTDSTRVRDTVPHPTLGAVTRFRGIQRVTVSGKERVAAHDCYVFTFLRGHIILLSHYRPEEKASMYLEDFEALFRSLRKEP